MLIKNVSPLSSNVHLLFYFTQAFQEIKRGREHIIHIIITSLSYSKMTFVILHSTNSALLNSTVTFQESIQKFLATCAIQNKDFKKTKNRKIKVAIQESADFWGKVSRHHCSPPTISYYRHTCEGLCQLASQVTYGLEKLIQSVESIT